MSPQRPCSPHLTRLPQLRPPCTSPEDPCSWGSLPGVDPSSLAWLLLLLPHHLLGEATPAHPFESSSPHYSRHYCLLRSTHQFVSALFLVSFVSGCHPTHLGTPQGRHLLFLLHPPAWQTDTQHHLLVTWPNGCSDHSPDPCPAVMSPLSWGPQLLLQPPPPLSCPLRKEK